MPVACFEHPGYMELKITAFAEPAEIIAAIEAHYPRLNPKYILWDLRGASLSTMFADRFPEIIAASAKYAEARGEGAKTAVVVDDQIGAMVIRPYADRAAMAVAVAYKTFTDREEAERWLQEG